MVFTLCTISQISSENTSVPENQIQAFSLPSTRYIQRNYWNANGSRIIIYQMNVAFVWA